MHNGRDNPGGPLVLISMMAGKEVVSYTFGGMTAKIEHVLGRFAYFRPFLCVRVGVRM